MSITQEVLDLSKVFPKDESIESYQVREYRPQMGQSQLNDNSEISIRIERQEDYLLPHKAYLAVEGQLLKADDTLYADADIVALTHNAIMHLFSEARYSVGGTLLETINNLGQSTTMVNLLLDSADYDSTVGLGACSLKDTATNAALDAGTGFTKRHDWVIETANPKGSFGFTIPLSRIFGFCKDYDRALSLVDHEIKLKRQDDSEAIFRAAGAAAGKVQLSKISLFMPYVVPSLAMKNSLATIIKDRKALPISYNQRQVNSFPVDQNTEFNRTITVSGGSKPRWVLVAFQTDKVGSQEKNASLFDHCSITSAYLELNGFKYPRTAYQPDFTKNQFHRVFHEATSFKSRFLGLPEDLSMTSLSPQDYKNLYPVLVFDLSKQPESLDINTSSLMINVGTSINFPANTKAYIVTISDKHAELVADGSSLVFTR